MHGHAENASARRLVASGRVVPLGTAAAGRSAARSASPSELRSLARRLGHPIYWAGARPNTTYEVTQTTDGRIYVRYLPPGVHVTDPRPNFLTVGTYPLKGAVAAVNAIAAKGHGAVRHLPDGGIAAIDTRTPTSAYLAFPRVEYEIEVYDPDASAMKRLVTSGRITRVG